MTPSDRPRRVVEDWEYQTSYIPVFQIRLPADLFVRLREWARAEKTSTHDLVVALIEAEVRRRETGD